MSAVIAFAGVMIGWHTEAAESMTGWQWCVSAAEVLSVSLLRWAAADHTVTHRRSVGLTAIERPLMASKSSSQF